MSTQAPLPPPATDPLGGTDTVVRTSGGRSTFGDLFTFRKPVSPAMAGLLGILSLTLVLGLWWFLTRGPDEERILGYKSIPSPRETFDREQLEKLWFDSALTQNLFASLRRVVLGFALAAAAAIPLGVLCGCFPWVNAFFAPMNVFGRNIPIAALIPLTYSLFGTDEPQKVMFIFIAAAAFIMMDTASAVADVNSRYIDTALTLGASRLQIVLKVLVPLAMPRLFNSLRLLFGLAFGYIMLVESITPGGGYGGIGNIINVARRLGHQEPIYLLLIVIPAVALAIDRLLYMVQKSLFPHQYGGHGLLHDAWRGFMHFCEDLKQMAITPTPLQPGQQAALAADHARQPSTPPTKS